MAPKTSTRDQSLVAGPVSYLTGSVSSKDGTRISYHRLGQGPGLVVLHGAMESAQSHLQLAEALADTFTVYLPDRRGRGLSGPFGEDYSVQKELEDLNALLVETDAHYIFGVSSGAIIALQATLALPTIRKAAIFEPPLPIDGSLSTTFLKRLDEELAQGKIAAALVTGMKAAQMGPPIFNAMPRWPLELLTKLMMASEDKKASAGAPTFRALAPTLHYDFQLVAESEGSLENFRGIQTELLMLGGSNSPKYLHIALDAIEKIQPRAKRIEFPGLNHGASGNANRGGQPERVAKVLREFLA